MLHSRLSLFLFQIGTTMSHLQSVGMILGFCSEHNRVCNHRAGGGPLLDHSGEDSVPSKSFSGGSPYPRQWRHRRKTHGLGYPPKTAPQWSPSSPHPNPPSVSCLQPLSHLTPARRGSGGSQCPDISVATARVVDHRRLSATSRAL